MSNGLPVPFEESSDKAPPHERRVLVHHVQWMPHETDAATIAAAQRRWLFQSIGYGAGLFMLLELLVNQPDLFGFMVAGMLGSVVGLTCERLSLGQLGAPLLAMTASFAHQIWMLNAAGGSPMGILFVPLGIGCTGSWLGLRRDMRPYD